MYVYIMCVSVYNVCMCGGYVNMVCVCVQYECDISWCTWCKMCAVYVWCMVCAYDVCCVYVVHDMLGLYVVWSVCMWCVDRFDDLYKVSATCGFFYLQLSHYFRKQTT